MFDQTTSEEMGVPLIALSGDKGVILENGQNGQRSNTQATLLPVMVNMIILKHISPYLTPPANTLHTYTLAIQGPP